MKKLLTIVLLLASIAVSAQENFSTSSVMFGTLNKKKTQWNWSAPKDTAVKILIVEEFIYVGRAQFKLSKQYETIPLEGGTELKYAAVNVCSELRCMISVIRWNDGRPNEIHILYPDSRAILILESNILNL